MSSKLSVFTKLKEMDCMRAVNNHKSLATLIFENDEFSKAQQLLIKKSKSGEEKNFMKTRDTWQRKLGTLTLFDLEDILEYSEKNQQMYEEGLGKEDDTKMMMNEQIAEQEMIDQKTVEDERSAANEQFSKRNHAEKERCDDDRSHISKLSDLKDIDFESHMSRKNIGDDMSHVSKSSKISKARSSTKKNDNFESIDDAASMISRSHAPDIYKSNRSEVSKVSKVSRAESATSRLSHGSMMSNHSKSLSEVGKYDLKRSGSVVGSVCDDRKSSVSAVSSSSKSSSLSTSKSKNNTVKSLSLMEKLPEENEESIKVWYHEGINELQTKFENNELREEQYKRKRAYLRAEYWTKLDKLRNNATPTVVNW